MDHSFSMLKPFVLLIAWSLLSALNAKAQVIPTPQTYTPAGGEFSLTEIIFDRASLDESEVSIFKQYLHQLTRLPIVPTEETEGVNLVLSPMDNTVNLPEGSYELEVTHRGIHLRYAGAAARMYGLISLVQLIREEQREYRIPLCTITDAPAFPWRGLHLDVSRHFFTVQEVKRYIDLMAFYKFNTFHWHLTDDQGWRIEIKKYPKLTEIGAFRDSTMIGHYNAVPRTWDRTRYGGYYTQEDIREVVEYAAQRNVTVVPEIEMPGHSRAALAAYPELSCTGEWQPVPGLWGVFEDIYCSKEESVRFMQDVLAEVIDLFPSEYIHIGGDEAPKMRWEECKDCQQVMVENDLKDAHELQSYFIGKMDAFLTERGKKLIGWDEILEGGLSPNATVMSWRGEEGGVAAATQSHQVVMSPTSHCYFDYYQSGNSTEPLAIGGYLPLEKVYDFRPVPAGIPEEKRQFVLGGQANLWTEYIADFRQVEYMVYPRALAMSENLWAVNKPSYEDFLAIFRTCHEPILHKMGVNYARSIYLPQIELARAKNGISVRLKGLDDAQHFDVFTKEKGGNAFGGGMVMGPEDSLYFERTADGTERLLGLTISGEEFDGSIAQEFTLHNVLGLPVKLVTQPHEKYNNGGDLTLVDGIRGKRPWKGDQWLGFNEERVEWIIELPEPKTVKSTIVGMLDAKGSWIYLPEKVEISISKDGKKWKPFAEVEVQDENQLIALGCKTRYIRFVTHSLEEIPQGAEGAGYVPWTFLDEVILNFAE